jgi:hypothetical protein
MLRLSKVVPLTMALAILALATLTIFVGCTSGNSTQARFVNVISDDKQSLDIEFNGTKAFNDILFPGFSASTYASVPAGSDKIQGFVTGSTTNPVFTETSPVSFSSGSQYTVVATGQLAGTVIILAPVDNNTAPANGSVNFSVINASLGGPGSVDVYILQDSAPGTNCFGTPPCPPTITALPSPLSSITPYTASPVTLPYNSLGFGYTLYVTTAGQTNPLPGFNGGYSFDAGGISVGSVRTIVLYDESGGGQMSAQPIVLSNVN